MFDASRNFATNEWMDVVGLEGKGRLRVSPSFATFWQMWFGLGIPKLDVFYYTRENRHVEWLTSSIESVNKKLLHKEIECNIIAMYTGWMDHDAWDGRTSYFTCSCILC